MAKRYEQSDLQNLPACAVDFIKLVIKKMRYRKKVRADVMTELTAHFEDELKNYKTDKEKEQKAKQLIAEFGDVKLLAVLLRRAKKRCRPLWRTVIARTFQTAGILILCLILYTVWFLTGKPIVTVDYVAKLNRIVRPTADESQNAALFYHSAAKLVEELHDDMKELFRKKYKEANLEEKQLIEKWLADNKEALDWVIAGTHEPYYWREYESRTGDMISVLLPNLSKFRNMAYALHWRAYLKAEQSKYEDAFSDIKSCYRFGQHLKGNKFLIEQLVGMAIENLAVQSLRDILDEHKINSTALAKLQEDFEHIIAGEDFTMSLKIERLFMYDEIQRCFTEDRLGGGHLYIPRIRSLSFGGGGGDCDDGSSTENLDLENLTLERIKSGLHVFFTHPNKQQSREMADRFWGFSEKMIHKTPAQIRAEGIDIQEEAEKIIKRNILLTILVPALWKINEISHRNRSDVEATLTIIGILRYKQDKGDYPDSLDELVSAGYLKELAMDPFSDEPLVYKKTNDSFILYSVGLNFVDDGGEVGRDDKGKVKLWADDGDAVFWPIQKN